MDASHRRALAVPVVASGAALASFVLWRRSRAREREPLRRSLTIARPAEDLRRLWQDSGALASVLGDLGQSEPVGPDRARVSGRGRFRRSFETEGVVEFRPGPDDWGTEVTLTVDVPGGRAKGVAAAKALRRLKSLAETGELPTTERNPAARGTERAAPAG